MFLVLPSVCALLSRLGTSHAVNEVGRFLWVDNCCILFVTLLAVVTRNGILCFPVSQVALESCCWRRVPMTLG